jgi:hypothetical protein
MLPMVSAVINSVMKVGYPKINKLKKKIADDNGHKSPRSKLSV